MFLGVLLILSIADCEEFMIKCISSLFREEKMKTKIVSLFICLLMAATSVIMTGCLKEKEIDVEESIDAAKDKATRKPMTLNLWLPTYEGTTEEATKAVEEALNIISKYEYNTAIELKFIPTDEYDELLKEKTEDAKKAKQERDRLERERKKALREQGISAKKDTDTTEEPIETAIDEFGISYELYPVAEENQMDVFLVRGYDNFKYYYDNNHLSDITESLNGTCKLIKSFVHPSFIDGCSVDGVTYGIANNHVIGEYTYLLVNKKLCERLSYDHEEFDTLLKCTDFIYDVMENTNVTPMLAPVEYPGIQYWSLDENGKFMTGNQKFSLVANMVTDTTGRASPRAGGVFAIKQFNENMVLMKTVKEHNGFAANPATATEFGVGVIKCSAGSEEITKFEDDYYIKVIDRPRATTEDVYEAVFAVSSYTADSARALEIIQLINTDADFRTILQYGVEGVHWNYVENAEEKMIERISDDYNMKLIETGNCFITYPDENVGLSYWNDGKQQNLDSMISPYLRFSTFIVEDEYDEKTGERTKEGNSVMLERLNAACEEYYNRIQAMSAAEYEEAYPKLAEELANLGAYLDATDDTVSTSLSALYQMHYDEYFKSKK